MEDEQAKALSLAYGLDLFTSDESDSIAMIAQRMSNGERFGQAFMNQLKNEYYTCLNGTHRDPYFSDDAQGVVNAIEYLVDYS